MALASAENIKAEALPTSSTKRVALLLAVSAHKRENIL
jgi:hypothetical protein